MTELNDHDLLAQFARTDCEAAFATLVARYVNLVYSAGLRFTGNPHHAQEITQAVFIILARKAGGLRRSGTVLSGWLYETARLTAANFVKGEIRRQRREQEAYMQSTLIESDPAAWEQIAPLLDDAMGRLGETDRNAIVLRFFENKTTPEVAVALKLNEAAAHKRVSRALEKLRKYFVKRGVTLSATLIAGAVAANSVQAAPAGLAVTVTAAAAKGAAVAGSTLALVKGALKIMLWTKAKTAIVMGAGILLAAGTTTVVLKEISPDEVDDKWFELSTASLDNAPDNLKIIRPTHFGKEKGWVGVGDRIVCQNQPLEWGINFANNFSPSPFARMELPADFPKGGFDYLITPPKNRNNSGHDGARSAVREVINRQFGFLAHREKRERNVLLLQVKNPNAAGLQKTVQDSFRGTAFASSLQNFSSRSIPIDGLRADLEGRLGVPVLDQTGLTNRFDIDLRWNERPGETAADATKRVLLEQLGLELVPSHEPVEMLIVEKVK